MMHAIGSGNIDAARTISEVLKSQMASSRTGATRPRFQKVTIDGKHYEIARDPFTGEELYRNEVDFPVSAFNIRGDVPTEAGRYADSTGTFRYNQVTGEMEPVYQNPDRPRSEAEGRAEAFVPMLQASIPVVDSFDENPPIFSGEMFNNWIAGNFTPDMPRELFTAAIPIGEAWLRQTTGAAYNDTEFRNAGLLLIPRTGDSPKVRQMKRETRHLLVAMSKQRAGLRLLPEEQDLVDNVETKYAEHLRSLQAARVAYDANKDNPGAAIQRAQDAFAGVGSGGGGIRDFVRNR